jgi:hypothetical protein
MTETVATFINGDLPVLDTWLDCRNTETGWSATRKSDGAKLDITYDPNALRCYSPEIAPTIIARMPEDKDYVFVQDERSRRIGVVRIERAP